MIIIVKRLEKIVIVVVVLVGCSAVMSLAAVSENENVAAEIEEPAEVDAVETNSQEEQGAGEESGTLPEAEPTVDKKQVSKECRDVVDRLAAGDFSAWEQLSPEKRVMFEMDDSLEDRGVYTCLAVASGNTRFCDGLVDKEKEKCAKDAAFFGRLKAAPQAERKALALFELCKLGSPVTECEATRAAVSAGDGTKCEGIETESHRFFCQAVATADASKCAAINEAERARWCNALVSKDPAQCSKESNDCRSLAKFFASVESKGLSDLKSVDPSIAATAQGKEACQGMIQKLRKACDER